MSRNSTNLKREANKRGRDNFSAPVKQLLAQRVGWLCSNPECRRPTIGPRMDEEGANNVGVAAHIKAASEGFARYDPLQSAESRKSFDNGIWLCQIHAHQIDHNEKHFTIEMLREWKRDAEQRAFDQLVGGGDARVYGPSKELIDDLKEVVASLRLPKAEDLDAVRLRVMSAATSHIDGFL